METITLQVGGMTCGGCTASISRALQAKPGVIAVNASLDSGTVEVQVQDNAIDRTGVEAAVEAAGFDVIR
jgi:copper chaperone